MFIVVKDLMDFLKDRKTNSDLLYQWLACAAAMLTIAAYVRHQRPSEVLAEVTRVWGLDSVWLGRKGGLSGGKRRVCWGRELRARSGYFSWSHHSWGHLIGLRFGSSRVGCFFS